MAVKNLREMNDMDGLRNFMRTSWSIISGLTKVAIVFITMGGTCIGLLVAQEVSHLPDMSYLKDYHPADSIAIYDRNDKLIESIELGMPRTKIPFKAIPQVLKEAVLAAEDKMYYQHGAVSAQGILRAMMANLKALRMIEGGSTITQQLAKNLFFADVDRTGVIKLAEAVAAYRLEEKYSKDELFSIYLSEIYFGNGARGIDQAAHVYFNKSAAQLTLPEAAFLAGIIRAPSYLGSKEHQNEAIIRQRQVLRAMVDCGFITQAQDLAAETADLKFNRRETARKEKPFSRFPYFTALVLESMHKRFDDRTIGLNGLRVYTTLDSQAQTDAEQTLASEIRRAPVGIEEEALVAIALNDGSVRALVGGAHDYWRNQWNCAVNPHTAGSSLKPFIYLTAFMAGVATPESSVSDTPYVMTQETGEEWKPKNYDGKYMGEITIREALLNSRNMCTIRVLEQVGIPAAVSTMKNAGIVSPLAPTMALALGSSAVTPMELAGAYGTIARGGVAITPWMIRRVEDSRGRILDNFQPVIHRVFPLEQTAWLVDVLHDVVRRGTGTQAQLNGIPVAGKTGTSDKAKDIWFVGFTPDMVTAVWGGGDDKIEPGKYVTGGTVMARVFRNFNDLYYRKQKLAGALLTSRYASNETSATPPKPISHSNDVPYSEIDPTYVQQAAPVMAAPARVAPPVVRRRGITEYHWDQ